MACLTIQVCTTTNLCNITRMISFYFAQYFTQKAGMKGGCFVRRVVYRGYTGELCTALAELVAACILELLDGFYDTCDDTDSFALCYTMLGYYTLL